MRERIYETNMDSRGIMASAYLVHGKSSSWISERYLEVWNEFSLWEIWIIWAIAGHKSSKVIASISSGFH
jgi:hypothetical protein